jgi:O-antigen/teichoic acid export membrane protein
MSRPKSLAANIIHSLGTNALMIPLSFALNVIIARWLGPAGKGAYDLFLATGTLLVTVVGFSLTSGIVYVAAFDGARLTSMLRWLSAILAVQAVLAWGAFEGVRWLGALPRFLSPDIGDGAILLAVAYVLLTLSASYWRSVLVGRQDIVWANRLVLLGRVIEVVIAVGLVLGVRQDALQAPAVRMLILAMLAGAVVSNLFLIIRVRLRLPTVQGSTAGIGEVVRFSAPCFLGNLAQFLVYRLDIFLVGFFLGQQAVGLYALATSLAQLIWLPAQAAATVLLPNVASQQDATERNSDVTARITRITLLACLVMALGLGVGVIVGVPIVYGDAYRPAIAPLLLLLPGVVVIGAAFVTSSFIAAVGRPGINMRISLVCLALTIVLDLVLIPWLGIKGAAVAGTIAYVTSGVLTFWAFSRLTGVPLRATIHRKGEIAELIAIFPRLILRRPQSAG